MHQNGMSIQNQMVSQKGIMHKIKMQKMLTDAMSFRLLQTTSSHITRYL